MSVLNFCFLVLIVIGLRREPIGQICVRLKAIGFKLMKVSKFA